MQKITISDTVFKKCEEFAILRTEDSAQLYKMRGENNLDKIKADIITGALAEFAVYELFVSKGLKISEPDLKIYSKAKKSYAADLHGSGFEVHVKSQTLDRSKLYGASWLFQVTDKLLTLPGEHQFIAFCIVNGREVDIRAVVANIELVEANLTKKPKIPKYAMTKNALYLDDILSSNINKWNMPNPKGD